MNNMNLIIGVMTLLSIARFMAVHFMKMEPTIVAQNFLTKIHFSPTLEHVTPQMQSLRSIIHFRLVTSKYG